MFITYSNFEEAIICVDTTEEKTIETYFTKGGRDLEDYDRKESKDEAVCVMSSVSID